MTNPTGPRVEAVARVVARAIFHDPDAWEKATHVDRDAILEDTIHIIKAADEASWQPIESAPSDTVIMIGWPNRTSHAAIKVAYEWRFPGGDVMHGAKFATVWQPLPTPPENP